MGGVVKRQGGGGSDAAVGADVEGGAPGWTEDDVRWGGARIGAQTLDSGTHCARSRERRARVDRWEGEGEGANGRASGQLSKRYGRGGGSWGRTPPRSFWISAHVISIGDARGGVPSIDASFGGIRLMIGH